MISNFKFKISNSEKGITLVEIIVVVFIIAMFSGILISDFPKIKRRIALSRAVYKFSQDVRKVQDMALSGVQITGAKGYGIYVDRLANNKEYKLYADKNGDRMYNKDTTDDYVMETIDLSQETSGVIIKEISVGNSVSINFNPPSPTTTITPSPTTNVEIVFALEGDPSASTGKVSINTSGLIEAK